MSVDPTEQNDSCSYSCRQCNVLLAAKVSARPTRELFCIVCQSRGEKLFFIERGIPCRGFVSMSAKQKRPGVKSYLVHLKQGWSISHDGVPAMLTQIVDKVRKRYRKRVEREDGVIPKDVEGPLNDQSLHGKQKQSKPSS